jgi:hypothetical protein
MLRRLREMRTTYSLYLESPHWRKMVAEHRQTRCEVCGAAEGHLYLHHVTYARLGREKPQDLCTLCGTCHESVHRAAASSKASLDPRPHQPRNLKRERTKIDRRVQSMDPKPWRSQEKKLTPRQQVIEDMRQEVDKRLADAKSRQDKSEIKRLTAIKRRHRL